ncbi:hypothetical protein L9F63_018694 [Diploptera punctata]|uniref:Calponin-homology (CH) domain-containing protein n=1 Tax=Diploptera punctata TaxID=6984 RepID=A0AAD7ZXA7_DIPPU|nr:hypothetical protein L9F63_018694 [Diploptera punctata]
MKQSRPKAVFRVGVTVFSVAESEEKACSIQLEKLPPEESGFKFSDTHFIVDGCQEKVLEIEWTPTEAGKWRYVIQVKSNHRLKLDITITCSCVDPRKGKKNVRPLRAHNSTSNVLAVKTGIKTCSQMKNSFSHGERKKSPNQSTKSAVNSEKLNSKYDFNMKNEKFASIKGNKLPPCTVPSTPTRRETYTVESNKENFKQLQKSTKPQNIAITCPDLRKPTNLRVTHNISESKNVGNVNEFEFLIDKPFMHINTPPTNEKENGATSLRRKTFDSHPGRPLERRIQPEKSTNSRKSEQNFKDKLDSLCLTPASTSVYRTENIISPDSKRFPPYTDTLTSDRRMTYNEFLSNSKFENESVFCTEEIVYTARKVKHSVSTLASDSPVKFNDSLEVFEAPEDSTKKWNEWQMRNCIKSDTSSRGSEKNSDSYFSPRCRILYPMKTTNVRKDLFFEDNLDTCNGEPLNLSSAKNNDLVTCSTIVKKLDNVSFSPTKTTNVCKGLFSVDDLDSFNVEPLNLSSDTYNKSESSFQEMSLHMFDTNNQEHVNNQTSCNASNLELSLLPEDSTAREVIEAGLWVESSQKQNVPMTKIHSDFACNLDTIGEESIETTFTERKNNTSEIETVKLEKKETDEVYLEISPPKSQISMFTDTAEKRKKISGIKGWSKFSTRSRIPHLSNHRKGAIHKWPISACNIAGKKRHTERSQPSEINNKRRILNDGSISEGKNTATGMSTKKSLKASIPCTPILKLNLKKPKEEPVTLYNPDSILNSFANPNIFGPTTTSEPFTTSAVYYDEQWLQEKEREFTKWLNSILTPPAELDSTTEIPKVDVAELWAQSCRKQEIELAPTREMVSSEYHTQHRLDALRKAACLLFRTEEIAQVLSKVVVQVDKKLIAIRGDRDIHLDFGLKCSVMKLLLNYNPLWLRIGLETVYGRTVSLESNSDVRGLTKFIMTHLLSDSFIQNQFTHPTVSHLYLTGFDEAMKKFILKKFLLLVYFLDKSKEKRLISHDPCLFCRNAELKVSRIFIGKSSREILLSFSRELLSGIGDITKHLKSLGYVVTQNQTYLDEFQYAVSCLGVDLRDGVRLTRVMEIILQKRFLLRELRVPAVSRLQKIHNVSVAITALKNAGYILTGGITAKDICDGHREKTLSLLWQIIYKFQIPRFGAAATKIQKWWRQQMLKFEIEKRIKARQMAKLTMAAITIQSSWRKYSAQKTFNGLKEEAKLRHKAAIIIQKNWKAYMNCKMYKHTLHSIKKIQTWYRNVKIMKLERSEVLNRRQLLVNFQANCRGYLFRKRLECLRRTAAALKIQTWYRRQIMHQKIQTLIPFVKKCIEEKQKSKAAVIIQKRLRATLHMRLQRAHFLRLKAAAITLQNRFRAVRLAKYQRNVYIQQKSAAIYIQNKFRARKLMKSQQQKFIQLRDTAINIQRKFRAKHLMREQRQKYLLQRSAAITIQNKFRATKLMLIERQNFIQLKNSVIKIQTLFRMTILMRKERQIYLLQKSAATTIQKKFRAMKLMKTDKQKFLQLKHASLVIQRKFRALILMRQQRQKYMLERSSVIAIQNKFRAMIAMKLQRKQFQEMRSATITIQNRFRTTKEMQSKRREFIKLKTATIAIQRRFRATMLMKEQRERYLLHRSAAITIQNRFRATKEMQSKRREFIKLKTATIAIQRRFRATMLMKEQRERYLLHRSAAITIQNRFRATKEMQLKRSEFIKLKTATIAIQRRFRATMLMKEQREGYLLHRSAAITIQNRFRATKEMQLKRSEFIKLAAATIAIQRKFRATMLTKEQRETYLLHRSAAITIQNRFRATKEMQLKHSEFIKLKTAAIAIQRRFRATMLMKEQREGYLLHRSAAITIQNRFRATKEMQLKRSEFIKLAAATIAIQRKFRATMLMKEQRETYLLHRSAAITIQNRFRATKEMQLKHSEFIKLKTAAIAIQRRFRATMLMKEQREGYLLHRSAAITIQNRFRATKEMQLKRSEFIKLKTVAIAIQRRFRATVLMREQKKKYQLKKSAAVTIQKFYRASKQSKIQRENFCQLKQATIFIQGRFRATLIRRHDRKKYLSLRSAAITIQNKLRATKQMQLQRKQFQEKKSAAIRIQRWYRTSMLMICERRKFILQRQATVLIQRKYRAYKLMISERQNFMKLKNATLIIQRKLRAVIKMQEEKSHYQLLQSTAIRMQCIYRRNLLVKRERENEIKRNLAAEVIQRVFRNYISRKNNGEMLKKREEENKRIAAAVKIQSLWRGYATRKTGTVVMKAVRERVLSTIRIALPDKILTTRSLTALTAVNSKSIGILTWAFMELANNLHLISFLCVDISKTEVINKIFDHMKNANRSEAYKEMCMYATKILINLSKYEKTVDEVWKIPGNLMTIANMMCAWYAKNDELFCNCCTLLWLFAKCRERAEQMLKDAYFKERLLHCYKQLKRKQEHPHALVKGLYNSTTKRKTKFSLPSTEPDWRNTGISQKRTFENAFFAVKCVMKEINLEFE